MNKDKFLKRITAPECVFLLKKERDELYLISDMETIEDQVDAGVIRTEEMDFLLENEANFLKDVVGCRGRYCGGVYIDDNKGMTAKDVYVAFVEMTNVESVNYFILKNDCVKNILSALPDGYNYVIVKPNS